MTKKAIKQRKEDQQTWNIEKRLENAMTKSDTTKLSKKKKSYCQLDQLID